MRVIAKAIEYIRRSVSAGDGREVDAKAKKVAINSWNAG